MLKRILLVGFVSICMLTILKNEAKAQYNYFGGGWEFCFVDPNTYEFVCSYHHKMTFTGVKGSDFKDNTVLFVSDTVWYDNAISCCVGSNCKNEPFKPGIGHVTLGESVSPLLDTQCLRKGKCTAEAVYPSSVADLNNSELYGLFCNAGETNQDCFLRIFGLVGQHCRNVNDTPVRISTKGVCATASAETCTDTIEPIDPSTCTLQKEVGLRFTFPSFDQKIGDSFAVTRDDRCIACVKGTGPCEP